MACDFWAHDTAKLRELQETVDELLEEAQANPAASRGKAAAVLRGHVGRMAQVRPKENTNAYFLYPYAVTGT